MQVAGSSETAVHFYQDGMALLPRIQLSSWLGELKSDFVS